MDDTIYIVRSEWFFIGTIITFETKESSELDSKIMEEGNWEINRREGPEQKAWVVCGRGRALRTEQCLGDDWERPAEGPCLRRGRGERSRSSRVCHAEYGKTLRLRQRPTRKREKPPGMERGLW